MTKEEDLRIVKLTLIRGFRDSPKQAIEWIKQNFPNARISQSKWYRIKKELEQTALLRLNNVANNFPAIYDDILFTIENLIQESFENLRQAKLNGEHKTVQTIIDSIKELMLWKANFCEATRGVIEVHGEPKQQASASAVHEEAASTPTAK